MNKRELVKELEQFLKKTEAHESISGFKSLEYVRTASQEWVYIIISPMSQKRINITWTSKQTIVEAVMKLLSDWNAYDYLFEGEKYEDIIKTAIEWTADCGDDHTGNCIN